MAWGINVERIEQLKAIGLLLKYIYGIGNRCSYFMEFVEAKLLSHEVCDFSLLILLYALWLLTEHTYNV